MNHALFHFLNDTIKNPVLDVVMPVFSDKDLVVIPGIAVALVVWCLGSRKARIVITALLAALAMSDLGSEKILKNTFQELRPYGVLESVNLHRGDQWIVYDSRAYDLDPRSSYAFPSSHASNLAAIAAVFWCFRRKTLFFFGPLALMVGFSRIYTGDHFPGDVLAGFVWGGIAGVAAWRGCNAVAGRFWPAPQDETVRPLPVLRKRFYYLLGAWSLCNFAFLFTGIFGLAGDEAQYWDWSRRLALGYYSKPPLIAYVIDIFRSAGGNDEWAIRSAAVILASGTLALIYALTRRITGEERPAFMAAAIALAMPAMWVGSVLITIDPLLIFFWTLTLYAMQRVVSGEPRMWLLTGLALGFGLLAKYTMGVLLLLLAIYLIVFDRRWFRHWGPYAALGIALAMNSGVIYWNWQHDWVSMRHTAAIGAPESWSASQAFLSLGEYLGAQAGVVGPLLAVFVVIACVAAIRGAAADRGIALLAISFWGLLGFYAIVALTRTPEANWPVCAYIAACPITAWWWRRKPRGPIARRAFATAIVLGLVLGAATRSTDLIYTLAKPDPEHPERIRLAGLQFNADADPTNHLRGGRELGEALSTLWTPKHENTFIFSDRYQLSALAAFYTPGRPETLCVNLGDRRYNQYDLWNEWPEVVGEDGLYISGGDRWRARYFIQRMVELGAFESGDPILEVPVYRGGILIKTYTISRLRTYTGYDWKPVRADY